MAETFMKNSLTKSKKHIKFVEPKKNQMENKDKETNTKRDRLIALFREYELEREDVFTMQMGGRKIPIVTRTGVEKIMSKQHIQIDYEVVKCERDFAAIKCTAQLQKGDKLVTIPTFATAHPKNCKSTYYLEMAEKRAKARAVLQITEFYSMGVYAEVEADEFKQTPPPTDKDEPPSNIEQAFQEYNNH